MSDDATATPARIRYLTTLAVLAVIAGSAALGWLWNEQRAEKAAAQQALIAAEQFIGTLTNIDIARIDENVRRTLELSTGEFKDKYSESSEQLRQILVENKAAAKGVIMESAVKSASTETVEVLMFVDQSVSNATLTEPRLDRSRIRLTMQNVDGQWLASKVELP